MRRPPQKDRLGRRVQPENAIWELSPGQFAIGSLKICQKITDSVPEDQEAVWEDADHNRFCIRPHSTDVPATYDENTLLKPLVENRSVGIYRVGGVVIKVKGKGLGGSSREPEAMKLIQKQAPSVPVPEVLHHWDDPHWFCHITIMREIPGTPLAWIWYKLDPAQQQRLIDEVADHIQAVAEIQSETAIYANGESLADDSFIPCYEDYGDGHAPERNNYYFNMKQLKEFLALTNYRHEGPSTGLGDRFHLCHMDTSPFHFIVYNGEKPPPGLAPDMSLEEQAKWHISGIIDWERSGFFPRHMVSWQFRGVPSFGLPYWQYGKSYRTSEDFHEAVEAALVKRGFPDSKDIHTR